MFIGNTSRIQKSFVFKLFHSGQRFQKVPFLRIFLCGYKRCSVNGRPTCNNKVAFSNLSGIVWTGPQFLKTFRHRIIKVKAKTRIFRKQQCLPLLLKSSEFSFGYENIAAVDLPVFGQCKVEA